LKTLSLLIILSFSALVLPMCKPSHAYDKYIKELDSLKIVVEQAIDHFKTIDSLRCYDAFSKQYTYNAFITTHVQDTVSKSSAEAMQAFFATGKPLNNYLAMRPVWLAEANARVKQLSTLSTDLKNDNIETAEAVEFINEEKKQSEKIIEELKVNTALLRKHLDLYAKNLPLIEAMIKERNSGQLPELIKPEIKLL